MLIAENNGPTYSGRFDVVKWDYNLRVLEGSKYLQIIDLSVHIRNQVTSIFMVTYLPTILMNIINQLTNYIRGDSKYDLIVTVNITSMMVLASIYLSVSSSLPSSSTIKPVEVWLLFNLAYPFLVILVNIILQVGLIFKIYCQENIFIYLQNTIQFCRGSQN